MVVVVVPEEEGAKALEKAVKEKGVAWEKGEGEAAAREEEERGREVGLVKEEEEEAMAGEVPSEVVAGEGG